MLTHLVDHLCVAVDEPRTIGLSGRCQLSSVASEAVDLQVSLATGGTIRHSVGLGMRPSPSPLETPSATRGDSHLADRLPNRTVRERRVASASRTRMTEASSSSVSTGGHVQIFSEQINFVNFAVSTV